jgi:hypothetical protein
MASVADTRPDAITQAIREKPDGTVEVSLYDATPATPDSPQAVPTGERIRYNVSPDLPVHAWSADTPAFAQTDRVSWPAVLEKVEAADDSRWSDARRAAWNQGWHDYGLPMVNEKREADRQKPLPNDTPAPMGYDRLNVGSNPYDRATYLARLTGETAEVRFFPQGPNADRELMSDFSSQLGDNKPVLVGTRRRGMEIEEGEVKQEAPFPNSLVPGHVYVMTGVENDRIQLHNPWGEKHPEPLTISEFREYFRNTNETQHGAYTTLK